MTTCRTCQGLGKTACGTCGAFGRELAAVTDEHDR